MEKCALSLSTTDHEQGCDGFIYIQYLRDEYETAESCDRASIVCGAYCVLDRERQSDSVSLNSAT